MEGVEIETRNLTEDDSNIKPEDTISMLDSKEDETITKDVNVDTRPIITENIINDGTREEIAELCSRMNLYIDKLEMKIATDEEEIVKLKASEERERHQYDPVYREKVLFRRFAAKEHELHEYLNQLNELKEAQIPSVASLKNVLLDPAVNLIIQNLRQELTTTKAKLEETQNELSAWKFTPDSNTGKRLMAKCRLLHQENEELGKMITTGRVGKIDSELMLLKNFCEEVKTSQGDLECLLQDVDEDVEGMQGTIYYLQQELKRSKEVIADLEQQNKELRVDGKNVLSQVKTIINTEDCSSNDSGTLILKISPEEDIETTQDEIPQKRSPSEDSDDIPVTKRARRDSEISLHYNDDSIL